MKEKYINEILELGKCIRGQVNGEGLTSGELELIEVESLKKIIKLRKKVLKRKITN